MYDKERAKEYYRKNKEKILARQKRRYNEDKTYAQEYYKRNREKILERCRAYDSEKRESKNVKRRERMKKYRLKLLNKYDSDRRCL